MSDLNVGVLVAAKEEYMHQLKQHMASLVLEGFQAVFEDAKKENETNHLRQFQIFLKQVPRWNQTIITQETERIEGKCPYLMNLVTAVFVSSVKILASVRLSGNHNNIKIKIPTAQIFVHAVYSQAAEIFYYDPQPFDTANRPQLIFIKNAIEECIGNVISGMIPVKEILEEYLGDSFDIHTENHNEPPRDETPDDEDLNDEDILKMFTASDVVEDGYEGGEDTVSAEESLNPFDSAPKTVKVPHGQKVSDSLLKETVDDSASGLTDLLGENFDAGTSITKQLNELKSPISPAGDSAPPLFPPAVAPPVAAPVTSSALPVIEEEITPDDSISQAPNYSFFDEGLLA